jgi:UPF0716 protein FxsA
MRFLLVLFITIPIVEMVILIEVGGLIGALPTVGLVLLTAVIGLWLLRLQGLITLRRVQQRLSEGEIPETELLEGVMLLIGGALLLTPGFVTDTIGFTCLLPGLRRPIARWLIDRSVFGAINVVQGRSWQEPSSTTTIEGEYREERKEEEGK